MSGENSMAASLSSRIWLLASAGHAALAEDPAAQRDAAARLPLSKPSFLYCAIRAA